jgi:hypothetical protein
MRTETHLQMEDMGFPLFGCCQPQVIKWKINKIVSISCLESATHLACLAHCRCYKSPFFFRLYTNPHTILVAVKSNSWVRALADRIKPKTIKLVFVASPLSTNCRQHYEERAKTSWLGIRIMCVWVGQYVYPWTVVSVS